MGDDPASRVYVNNKKKACAEIGIHSEEYALPKETTQEELLDLVRRLNDKKDINGILVQLPLPKGLDEKEVIETISPLKDVDAFHPQNVGRIMIGDYHFLPCTPAGVMELLKSADVEICGRDCVVIGRSNIVGKPMAMLLLHQSGTVTICHSKTQNLKEVVRRRGFPERRARCFRHYAGAWRRRPDDHRNADEKHHSGGKAAERKAVKPNSEAVEPEEIPGDVPGRQAC